ncbi:hypothetical protein QZH41_017176, partial [Actinostola sp. cb2023]
MKNRKRKNGKIKNGKMKNGKIKNGKIRNVKIKKHRKDLQVDLNLGELDLTSQDEYILDEVDVPWCVAYDNINYERYLSSYPDVVTYLKSGGFAAQIGEDNPFGLKVIRKRLEVADILLAMVLREGGSSARIDVVFDVYRQISINYAESEKRGAEMSHEYRSRVKLARTKLYATAAEECYEILSDCSVLCKELRFIRFFFSTLTLIVSILFFRLPSNQICQQAFVSYKCFVNSDFRQPVLECFESSRGSDIEVV